MPSARDEQHTTMNPNETNTPEVPAPTARRIDATAMKAFAHPLRMAMYDYLNDHGAATATMLAKHTGESTGQTSYHLRQLERHGFVEDDSTRGKGRERWWKAVGFSVHGLELSKDTSARPAVAAMLRNQVNQQSAALHEWFARSENEDPEWDYISTDNRYTMLLKREELIELERKVIPILSEYAELARDRENSGLEPEEDMRRIRMYLHIFPLPE